MRDNKVLNPQKRMRLKMILDLGESNLTVHILLIMANGALLVMTSKNELMSIFCNEKYFNMKQFRKKFSLVEN